MASSPHHLLLSIFLAAVGLVSAQIPDGIPGMPMPFTVPNFLREFSQLSLDYYDSSCPGVAELINKRVQYWIDKDPSLAPSLLRLHSTDCMIKGCDASILLNHEGSERQAPFSKTLRGFEVIDDIKAELEKKCPRTVTCSDILATVARDAIVKVGGPYWEVGYGRKDGTVSLASDIDLLPQGRENVTYLIEFFQSRGMSLIDLVVLSGAHTLGRATCGAIQDRLYDFKGTKKADPSINPSYLNYLKRRCRWSSDYVFLDVTMPDNFDNTYYKNLQKGMGLLATDQLLFSDSRTGPIVEALASQPMLFRMQFPVSMLNLADTEVLTGDEGEVRLNCNYVNP